MIFVYIDFLTLNSLLQNIKIMDKINGSLQRFLQRIARHPILRRAEFFIMFLESPEFVSSFISFLILLIYIGSSY